MIDSFPMAICKFGRAGYCQSFRQDGAGYGKCPSKKETYYGYKVYTIKVTNELSRLEWDYTLLFIYAEIDYIESYKSVFPLMTPFEYYH